MKRIITWAAAAAIAIGNCVANQSNSANEQPTANGQPTATEALEQPTATEAVWQPTATEAAGQPTATEAAELLTATEAPELLTATEVEAVVANRQAGVTLAGTLTVPEGRPKAVAVLVSGSGQQDRDEEILGHRPFRALAQGLAARGIATLRYDDRGAGGSSAGSPLDTTDDFAADAAAALAWADSVMGGAVPVGIIGHSEGGTIAIKLGAHNRQCHFIVTLAAPAVRGDSLVISQLEAILRAQGQGQAFEKVYQAVRPRYDMAMSQMPATLLKAALLASVEQEQPMIATIPAARDRALAEIEVMASPWYRQMLRYDPEADIRAVGVPWLAINGSKDTQVVAANLDRIAELNPAASTVLMPGLNHLLIKCITGSPAEYSSLPGDLDEAVTDTIAAFIDEKITPLKR